MFIKYLRKNVFNKISVGLNDRLQAALEPVASKSDLLPGQVAEHLRDLCDQGLLSVVGGFIKLLFSDAPDIIVEGAAVWAARRPTSLLVGASGCSGASLFAPTDPILSHHT